MTEAATQQDASIEQRIQAALEPEVEEAPAEEAEVVDSDSQDTQIDDTEETEAQVESDDEITAASFLGIPDDRIVENDDGELLVAVKVDGKTEMVSPAKLVENYQREAHANAKTMEAAEREKEAASRFEQYQAEYSAKLSQAEAAIAVAGKQIADKYNGIDWATLEAQDPGQAALLRQKLTDEGQTVLQQQQGLMQARQQQEQLHSQEVEKHRQQRLESQMDELLQKNPRWIDHSVRERDMRAMKSYLAETYGADDAVISGVETAMQVEILQKAMLYDQGRKAADKKLSKPVPQFQKPGKRSGPPPAEKEYAKKRARLKRTGSSKDLAAVLEDIL